MATVLSSDANVQEKVKSAPVLQSVHAEDSDHRLTEDTTKFGPMFGACRLYEQKQVRPHRRFRTRLDTFRLFLIVVWPLCS